MELDKIDEALRLRPVVNSSVFTMGIEAGMQAVGQNGDVYLLPVIPALENDEDFVSGRIKGVCLAILCGLVKSKGDVYIARNRRPVPLTLPLSVHHLRPAARRRNPHFLDEGELDSHRLNLFEECCLSMTL